MPIYRTKDERFFKKWTPEMAYILGFFTADGTMVINPRGSHYIEFQNTEQSLLEKFQVCMSSNHKITKRLRDKDWKPSYRLQIGSKQIFEDLLKLGLAPRKKKRIRVPQISKLYLSDFVRGYFDGDGNVWCGYQHKKDRLKPTRVLLTRFTNSNKNFLIDFSNQLAKEIGLSKKPSILFYSGAYRLNYSTHDSIKLYRFMYRLNPKLYLERKRKIFEKFINGRVV